MNFQSLFGVPNWVTYSFPTIRLVLIILMVVLSVMIMIAILIQPSGNESQGALTGQSSDTYFSKNKKTSLEGVMKRVTIALGITVAVISIVFFITVKVTAVG